MSMYGTIYRINGTLGQAREWADMKHLRNCSDTICVAGGKRKMREFCLGTSISNFEENLNYAPVVHPDDEENAYDWHVE